MSSEPVLPEMPEATRSVAIIVPCATCARAWIPALAASLRDKLGVATHLVTAESVETSHLMTAPERLERKVVKSSKDYGRVIDVTTVTLKSLSPSPALIIDATGQLDPRARPVPVLRPVLNGHRPEASIVSAVWARKSPQLGVGLATGQGWKLLHAASVAIPDRELTVRALDAIFRRQVALLVEATAHILYRRPIPALAVGLFEGPTPVAGEDVWKQAAHGYLPKVARQFTKRFIRRNDWCIGYRRRTRPPCFPEDLDLRPETFAILSSPPSRFYADPFLFEQGGQTYLFFEDYDYSAERGHISFVTLGSNGPSEPRVALVRPYHLSYPFIFAHEGRTLMIPETSNNRSIELYEATMFPDAWRLQSVLVPNINASDVTLYRRNERWLMFATVVEHDSSSWDSISVFWADALEGPWHSHPMNPVKYDVSSARSAGALIEEDGRLIRPTQDCSNGYGSALTWCLVTHLTETRFSERLIARQTCPPGSSYYGMHTYNRTAAFETVDFKRSRRR